MKTTPLFALGVVATLALSGCASSTTADSQATESQAGSVSFTDGWAKAVAADGMGMSAIFGNLSNSGSTDANLVSADCGDIAGSVELHETVTDASGSSNMQEKDGGFVIPAGGSFELAPGGNHIMLMGLTTALTAGDQLSCVVTFADSSTMRVEVPIKDFSGANENYNGSTPSATMNMG